ncbi:hypothetical protein [Neobacillus sp. LXY-1]|uniref:hypothetical protein n=1 Tax=Neobacillus sp. LXY-1 TaxID=3379133 RepID=UPI003EE13996
MNRVIFGSWHFFSFALAIIVCTSNLPIRDDYFPAIQDYIDSLFFLVGLALILSIVTYVSNFWFSSNKIRFMLIVTVSIFLIYLFSYLFRSMIPPSFLITEALLIIAIVSSLHYWTTYFLGKLLLKEVCE